MSVVYRTRLSVWLWIITAIVINGCAPITPGGSVPAAPPMPQFSDLCPQEQRATLSELVYKFEQSDLTEKDRYLPSQVLLTGSESDIASVVDAVNQNADYGVTVGQVDNPVNQIVLNEAQVVRAYQVVAGDNDPQQAVLIAISAIYREALNQAVKLAVEPNYLLRAAETTLQGDPGSGEASPGSGEASPGSGEASPGSGEASPAIPPTGAITNTSFWGQWALGDLGIQLISGIAGDGSPTRTVGLTGQETEIAVFDTSLFPREGFYRFAGKPITEPLQYGWIDPALEICVSHPVDPNMALPGDSFTAGDHGLFVAALAHAVAPNSRIRLIRVLGNNRRGDLFGIVYALAKYKAAKHDHLENVVVNLSLGIVETPVTIQELPGVSEEQWQNICAINAITCDLSQPLPTVALDTVLSALHNEGAMIVAAAGNRSANQHPKLSANIPASYAYVLGVAGSNTQRTESCFSNQGTIADMDVHGPAGDNPEYKGESCVNPQPCTSDLCLKSMAAYTYPSHGFALWNGTSFATPLASGLAALAFEAIGAVDASPATPSRIHKAIVCAANAHDEIINVPATIDVIERGACPE